MTQVIPSLIAVAGTLLGATAGAMFGRLNSRAAERSQRAEQLRQERITAYSQFCGVAMNYREAQHRRATLFIHSPDPEYKDATGRSYQLRAEALQALYRLKMVTDDPALAAKAEEVMKHIHRIIADAPGQVIDDHGARAWEAIEQLVVLAHNETRAADTDPSRDRP